MHSIDRPSCGSLITGFPRMRQPKPEIADRGTVRLGDACIAAQFPTAR